ncbi:metal-dependent hydrolase, partial [Rhizobiaceae sp. 2RAB30]
SDAGARALGLAGYGLHVGAPADFVTLDAVHVPEAVVAVPKNRDAYKSGKRIVMNGKLARIG